LAGKVVVTTGTASGIGKENAQEFVGTAPKSSSLTSKTTVGIS
jgi:NADP-dependent 3-hydroxy acid dehydrogenase YdfG